MHSCRDFALVFPSALCICPATVAGMRGRSGASSSFTPPPPPPTPPCVFLTQISFVTLFLCSLCFFKCHFLQVRFFSLCVRGISPPPLHSGMWGGCYLVCPWLCAVVVVVRNQWMTSPLHRECVFALFLECRPVRVCE